MYAVHFRLNPIDDDYPWDFWTEPDPFIRVTDSAGQSAQTEVAADTGEPAPYKPIDFAILENRILTVTVVDVDESDHDEIASLSLTPEDVTGIIRNGEPTLLQLDEHVSLVVSFDRQTE